MRNRVKSNAQFEKSALLNNISFEDYFLRLKELAISRFQYVNVPSTIDVDYLETCLFEFGSCALFNDEIIGHLCLKYTSLGHLDVYGKPIKWNVYSSNGYYKRCDKSNSVIVYNNMLKTPSRVMCFAYAKKLYLIDRTIDVNVNAQKTPILIKATPEQRLTMLNLYKQYDGNAPYIFGSKNLDVNDVEVLTTNAPFLADKLHQLKIDTWNEILTYLGITNLAINKRERLITDEVQKSQGGTIASRNSALTMRQKAIEYYNNLYDLNIQVVFNPDYEGGLINE